MPRRTHTYEDDRIVSTWFDYDSLDLPPGESRVIARTSNHTFNEFSDNLLQRAARWVPTGDSIYGLGRWEAVDNAVTDLARRWMHRELVTLGFLWEMAIRDFILSLSMLDELIVIREAFQVAMSGRARISMIGDVPVISALEVTPRVLLTASQLLYIGPLQGEPVDYLHRILGAEACSTRPHDPEEIEALLRWADSEFVACGLELIERLPGKPGEEVRLPTTDAKTNANALVSVVRGCCGIEWAGDGPVFTQCDRPAQGHRKFLRPPFSARPDFSQKGSRRKRKS